MARDENTMVFVHGLGQDATAWNDVLKVMPDTLTLRVPSLLKSTGTQQLTYQTLYKSFETMCLEYKAPIQLCGLSLGAILSLNYAIDHPERVKSLVLIAPQYRIPKFLFTIQNGVFRILPQKFFKNMGFSKNDTLSLMKSMTHLDFTSRLDAVHMNTWVLCGTKDRANRKAAESLTTLLSNATFKQVSDAGHEVNKDNPLALAAILNSIVCGE
ncbi:alpha/beta hydrolase [Erysipelothrix sp. HDW6B]|uniref:alpha/beta fold hydrolase n=1 Tax=Erysipelothrix sp. HDW6B TaxID=2714929 RepID=UPI00140AAD5F|nr:alpha/beta hydrolase [Erysipelothrix sp. HDW6B]QIK86507.1 alpha/beta hydrolase [Erysipelothrix sp. HDW6B]